MAFQRWQVQYADFGGVRYPAVHTDEARAKVDAESYLRRLIKHLMEHARIEEMVGRNEEYVSAAEKTSGEVGSLLDKGLIWTAYQRYKKFEKKWDGHFSPFSLTMSIGSMRVVPDPKPEA